MNRSKRRVNIKPSPVWKKRITAFITITVIALLVMLYSVYRVTYAPNVSLKERKDAYLLIPSGSGFDDVLKILQKEGLLMHPTYFRWMAIGMGYDKLVKPGRYHILEDMSSRELVQLLKSGKQAPVKLVINSARTKDQLVSRIAHQLEVDSLVLSQVIADTAILNKYGLNETTAVALFVPATYEVYWNINPKALMDRISDTYVRFWNTLRLRKADEIGFSQLQVITLASIVEQESRKKDERPIIAGVYINRLHRGYKLEADPTLVYAVGDFSIRRVLNIHKEIDSPYNTYKYMGLPPGPICIPSEDAIDAVLNYNRHNYLYFCAKEDFSGYHNFAANYAQHQLNARKYQKELNKRNIKA